MLKMHLWLRSSAAVLLALFFVATPGMLVHAQVHVAKVIGPKAHYLALGDSLAFGYQPDLNFTHGYANDFEQDLQSHGGSSATNMACPGETSTTLINGGCPYPYLRKYPYVGSQLQAALTYLAHNAGQVSPVTLQIGANDLLSTLNSQTCTFNAPAFTSDLSTLDANLTQTILPRLHAALQVNGVQTGDLVVVNYYDPYQNLCPGLVSDVQTINQHIAQDVGSYGQVVDVFGAFGGPQVPNANICSYTWMCSPFNNIHATTRGYSVMAQAIEQSVGY